MKFTTERRRFCDHELAVMFLRRSGFVKVGDDWVSGNRWAVIEQHINGKDSVIQIGGVC